MTTQSSALINSLSSGRAFLDRLNKPLHVGPKSTMPPAGKPANHQLTVSTIRALPRTHTTPPAGSVLQVSSMPPPSQKSDSEAPMTLQGLLESYGQKDPTYDLNKDGVVNVLDLIQFLMQGAGSSSPAAPPDIVAPPLQPSNSPGETVMPPAPPDVAAPPLQPSNSPGDVLPPASPDPEDGDEETAESLTLKGLLTSWGQADSPYDLNADGVVNVLDLIQWLMDDHESGEAPRTHITESSHPAPERATSAAPAPNLADLREQVKLRQMADTLVSNLADAGFTRRPPSDIAEALDVLKLNGHQKRFVLGHVATRFSQGLGVNLVG